MLKKKKKKKETYLSVCAWGNQTPEASVSEIKGVWQESPAEPE